MTEQRCHDPILSEITPTTRTRNATELVDTVTLNKLRAAEPEAAKAHSGSRKPLREVVKDEGQRQTSDGLQSSGFCHCLVEPSGEANHFLRVEWRL